MLIIETAIAKYGEENQLRQTQEELAELIVAINKYERCLKKYSDSEAAIEYSRKEIIAEMTDVLIMLDSVKKILDISEDEIQLVRDFKLKRLLNRMKGETK